MRFDSRKYADSLRDDHLHPAGQTIGVPKLGWYAFRHTIGLSSMI